MDLSKYSKDYAKTQNTGMPVSGAYVMKINSAYIEEQEENHALGRGQWSRVTLGMTPVKRIVPSFIPLKDKPTSMVDVVAINKKLYKVNSKVVEIPHAEGEEKNYKFTMYIKSRNKDTYQLKILLSAFWLTNESPKFKTKPMPVDVYDFDEKGWVSKNIDSYTELIGKEIGVMMKFAKLYPTVFYDGYTGVRLFGDEIKNNPYAIRLKDYSADQSLSFTISHFFAQDTYQTLSEREDKEPPTELYRFMHELVDFVEEKASDKEMVSKRKEELIKHLSKNRQKFQPSLFSGGESASQIDEITPYAGQFDDLTEEDL